MKLTRNRLCRAEKWIGMGLAAMVLGWTAPAETLSTTTVQGTVYLANGAPGSGTLQLSWPAFTTVDSLAVAAGKTSVAIGADGLVSVSLAPNLGAAPAGLFYTAIYHMSDGTTSTEYWVVPEAAEVSLASVRAQVMPAAQAVKAVSKSYVDHAIQSLAEGTLTPVGGSLSGPLYLNGDPTQSLQAADKQYVDSQFSTAVQIAQNSGNPQATDANQVPISVNAGNSQYRWTNTKSLAGSGAAIPTGPATSTSGNITTFTGGSGQIQDSGVSLGSLASLAGSGAQRFSGPITSPSLNGVLNESYFAGATVTARVQAACASLGGASGAVLIPSSETGTDSAFGVYPVGCMVNDRRAITYPVQSGFTTVTAPRLGDLRNSYWNTAPTSDWSGTFIVDSVAAEATAGGQNTYDGSTGVKTNYLLRNTNLFSTTPGQHSLEGLVIKNNSPGDTYLRGAQIYDTGWATASGDEGLEASTIYLFAGMPALTATVSSISGSTLTLTCGTNCDQLGEQQAIVDTTAGVQSTGTAALAVNSNTVTITGGTVTCPGGTNPCSSNTPGGVGLFFEFNGEVFSGHHIVLPVIAVDAGGTNLTVLIQNRDTTGGVPTNTSWQGNTTSGAYKVYRGTTITAVPYTSGVFTTIQAVVGNASIFTNGDGVLVPGGNNRNMNGHSVLLTQNVPYPSNGGSSGFLATSGGQYPIAYGVSAAGAYKSAVFRGDWTIYNANGYVPKYGITLNGVTPSSGYYEGADFANLTATENLLCGGTHSNGVFTCLNVNRTAGATQDYWQIPNVEFTGSTVFDSGLTLGANIANNPTAAGQGFQLNGFGTYAGLKFYIVEGGGYVAQQAAEQMNITTTAGNLSAKAQNELYLDSNQSGFGVALCTLTAGEVCQLGGASNPTKVLGQLQLGSAQQTTWDVNGVKHESGSAPVASAGTITGTNAGGFVASLSAATTVTLTFANSGWTTWASCVANTSVASTQPYVSAISKTAVTFTFSSLTGTLYYQCNGK